jgi:hypothetical protein
VSDIVLLYSHADDVIAQRVLDDLDDAEFDVWTEDELNPGSAEWKQSIRSAIKASEVVIVLMSPHATRSSSLEEAIGIARLNKAMFFPVLVDGELRQSTPAGLRVDQFTDLRGNYDDGVDELLDMLDDYFERFDEEDLDDDEYDDDNDDFEDDDDFLYDDDDDLDFGDDFDESDDDFVADDDDF